MMRTAKERSALDDLLKYWPMILAFSTVAFGVIWWGATLTADVATLKEQNREMVKKINGIYDYVYPPKDHSYQNEPQESKNHKPNTAVAEQ